MLLKVLATIAVVLAGFVLAGVLGLYFYIWPTNLQDQSLAISPEVIEGLKALKYERKFDPDPSTFYPGAVDEPSRAFAQAGIDAVIDSLIRQLPSQPRKSLVLMTFKVALAAYDPPESEDRDQFLAYLERIMRIVGVKSSGELLNVWRYGFPYGWLERS
jgi:hypothetical protein